jgi:hypothetical protein
MILSFHAQRAGVCRGRRETFVRTILQEPGRRQQRSAFGFPNWRLASFRN